MGSDRRQPWLRLSCGFFEDDRVAVLSREARELYLNILLHAQRHETDGVVTMRVAARLPAAPQKRTALRRAVDALVGCGLLLWDPNDNPQPPLHEVPTGCPRDARGEPAGSPRGAHGRPTGSLKVPPQTWARYNRTADQIAANRQKYKEKMGRWRHNKNNSRLTGNPVTNQNVTSFTDTDTDTDRKKNGEPSTVTQGSPLFPGTHGKSEPPAPLKKRGAGGDPLAPTGVGLCIAAWEARFGKGTASGGRIAKAVTPLLKHHPPPVVAAALATYLDQPKDPGFLTPEIFARTFADWLPDPTDPPATLNHVWRCVGNPQCRWGCHESPVIPADRRCPDLPPMPVATGGAP